ncbi:Lipase maturation factor 2 [Chamberlinius hualienensis]
MAHRSKSKDKHADDKTIALLGSYEFANKIFLWLMAASYFFAFGSIYFQIPGLYGDTGILPARMVMRPVGRTFVKNFGTKPTLVWAAPFLGLDVQFTLEAIALLGLFLSFFALLLGFFRNALIYAVLWALYFSIYQVGQVFTWFQWDILLLEAGFLTILVAPLNFLRFGGKVRWSQDRVTLWLVRWLLFRLMFAAGVVKLTSMCPTWWQLTALNYHFETQCIPMPLAWYVHHLPSWLLQLGVVGTYLIEIPIPFLIFSPVRSLRIFTFYSQVLFQVLIMLTGNYNFFNFLTIALCFSLLDDYHLLWKKLPAVKNRSVSIFNFLLTTLRRTCEATAFGVLFYAAMALFSVRLNPDLTFESKIAFTNQSFNDVLQLAITISIYIGSASLICTILYAIYEGIAQSNGFFSKFRSLFASIFFGAIALWILCISTVPHTSLHRSSHAEVWPVIRRWHDLVGQYQIVNPYGLFRKMTGVGGRPEIVIEGSNSIVDGWKEYHFDYKPGNLSSPPQFIIPHQPRLDWQMWFAALGTYQENPWFVSLINRLLHGDKDVLKLLDQSKNPFPKAPPKYIRAVQYLYNFTPANSKGSDWWTRKKVGEYFPAVNKGHQVLKDFLLKHNIITDPEVTVDLVRNHVLRDWLRLIRSWICVVPAPHFLWSLFTPLLTISFLRRS